MKIQLAPREKLVVGFYVPASQQESSGWRSPEDQPLDGEFTIEFGNNAIIIKADMPDDSERGGGDEPIYCAGFGSNSDDDIISAED